MDYIELVENNDFRVSENFKVMVVLDHVIELVANKESIFWEILDRREN